MKKLLSVLCVAGMIGGCSTTDQAKLDTAVVKITASIQQYCAALQIASGIASDLDKKTVVSKIDAGVNAYCSNDIPVTDVPTALVKLAQVFKVVVDAGVPVKIPVAAN